MARATAVAINAVINKTCMTGVAVFFIIDRCDIDVQHQKCRMQQRY
jgi:hypothetical protein